MFQTDTTSLTGLPQDDVYWMLTFRVDKLARVTEHLQDIGMPIVTAPGCVNIEAADGLGVCWSFVDHYLPRD